MECKHGENCSIPYPCGKAHAKLGRDGLVGKVHLTSEMTVKEVEEEIRSVFQNAMGSESFPFKYLQATGGGSRSLSIPQFLHHSNGLLSLAIKGTQYTC